MQNLKEFSAKQLLFFIRSTPLKNKKVLEVGCGSGELGTLLARAGVNYTGIDVSYSGIKQSRDRKLNVLKIDFMKYKERNFDVILFTRSLHHISNLKSTLRHVKRMLKPSGMLILDEFAWEKCDESTAMWFFSIHEWFGFHGNEKPRSFLNEWKKFHFHEPQIHTSKAILWALQKEFVVRKNQWVPYLYRELPLGSTAVPNRLYKMEEYLIQKKFIEPLGFQLIANCKKITVKPKR